VGQGRFRGKVSRRGGIGPPAVKMASMEDLRSQVFTMKMRCHEYEQRLMKVNLHGLNGETLQRENTALEERLDAALTQVREKEENVVELKGMIRKTGDAMIRMQSANLGLKERLNDLKETEEKLAEKMKECEGLALEVEQQKETLAKLEATEKSLEETKAKLEIAEAKASLIDSLEQDKAALQDANSKTFQLLEDEKARNVLLAQELERERQAHTIALSNAECSKIEAEKLMRREREDVALVHQERTRKLETELEALRLQLERNEGFLKDANDDVERLQRANNAYLAEGQGYREELATCRAEIATQEENQTRKLRAIREEIELEFQERLDSELRKFEQAQRENWKKLNAKDIELSEVITKLNLSKEKFKVREAALKDRYIALEEELHKVKSKWKSSITAKKRTHVQKENTRPAQKAATPPGSAAGRKRSTISASSASEKPFR